MHSVSDPCWAAATKHLTTRTLLELESEAFGWRQNLSASLQRYYDDEHAAYLATAPGLEANIIQRWQAEYMPRPGASWPSEEDGKYWTRRNRKKGFYGTLDHPLRVRPDLVRDRDELSMSSEAYTRRRWDFFLPTGSVARMKGTACRDPTPLVPRGHHDDHKVVCRTKELTGRNCTVYSIGSNSEWEFENALIKTYPNCKVHTFDCTSGPPQKDSDDRTTQMAYGHYKRGQLQFHKICIGSAVSTTQFGPFEQFGAVMNKLGHKEVSLLKLDAEGFEWEILPTILESLSQVLPNQILLEAHYRAHMHAKPSWWRREMRAGEIALVSTSLFDSGYRVVSGEVNVGCPSCMNFGLMRVHCLERCL